MRRVLYVSCHEILEYDEVRMLLDAGYSVFSIGAYSKPGAACRFRPPLPNGSTSQEDFDAFTREVRSDKGIRIISKAFADRFDLVIVTNFAGTVLRNLEAFEGKPVIYRSVGSTRARTDAPLLSIKHRITTVRCSPREADIPGIVPTDYVIRFGKYHSDFQTWSGTSGRLATFYNQIATRWTAVPNLNQFSTITGDATIDLYGLGNESVPQSKGLVDAKDQVDIYAKCAAYLYVHTAIAPYTLNFLEALMTGTPIIAPSASFVGATVGSSMSDWQDRRYEAADLLRDGAGLVYSNLDQAARFSRDVLASQIDLTPISKTARERAITLFDATVIMRQWAELIESLC
jgi:glycosyltransferase involved in cell wall biosynthesis